MRPGPSAVTLERFPAALLRELVEGTLERPAEWHEEYPAAGLRGIARMLLGAYEAMGVPADDASPWWVSGIVVDGQVVGDAGFHGPPAGEPPVEVEIGYQVVPAFRGRGLATRSCALLLEHAWAHGADVVRADVEADNPHGPASHAVLRANGFRPTPQGDLAVAAPHLEPDRGRQPPDLTWVTEMSTAASGLTRHLVLDRVPMLNVCFGLHRRGSGDPTHRTLGGIHLRTTRVSTGPALLKVVAQGTGVSARAWGDGAEQVLDHLPRFLGEHDDLGGFEPRHPAIADAHRRYGHFRVGRSDAVFEALAPACIEQVVTGKEAFRAFRLLVREFGEPAPGPTHEAGSAAFGMFVAPTPEQWARVPSWRFLAAGVEQRRSRTLVRTAQRATALERTLLGTNAAADAALQSFPGLGPWTSAEVRQRAHGDADAWSVGDYHVGKNITWALTGEVLDDDAATELLEPYRGHRFRVQQLLALVGARRPRHGPRMTLPTHTPYATRGRS